MANSTTTTTTTTTGTVTILLFASAASYTNDTDTLTLAAPMTLGDIFTTLEQQYPGITAKVLRSSAFTVNLEYVDVEFGDDDNDDNGGAGGARALDTDINNTKVKSASGHLEGWDTPINPGDEVGIIPPVSSG